MIWRGMRHIIYSILILYIADTLDNQMFETKQLEYPQRIIWATHRYTISSLDEVKAMRTLSFKLVLHRLPYVKRTIQRSIRISLSAIS